MGETSFAHTKWECKYHIVLAQVPQKRNPWQNKSRYRENTSETMCFEESRNHKSERVSDHMNMLVPSIGGIKMRPKVHCWN